MIKIIPAILARNMGEFEEKFNLVLGKVERVQVDIVDGVFAEARTVGPEELGDLDTVVEFDMHLMVEEPVRWIDRCVTGGASRIFGQVEKMSDFVNFVAEAQVAGLGVGLALDIETPVEIISEVIYDLDGVLLMAVKAGASGQEFDDRVLAKIEKIREMRDDVTIVIDGGLNEERIKDCVAAEWAEEIREGELHRNFMDMEFAVGTHLFDEDDIEGELGRLQHLEIHKG